MVDNFTTPDDFAKTYQELYTSVDFDKVEMIAVRNDIDFAVSSFDFNGDCVISCKGVEQAINRLNPGKSDGNGGLKTNHVISAGNDLSVYVSLFLSGLLAHGSVPEELLLYTVIPILKAKNINLTDSANYRGIVLSSITVKFLI